MRPTTNTPPLVGREQGPSPVRTVAQAYAPERPLAPIDLRLAGNEGAPPDTTLLKALAALEPDELRRYPSALDLEAELARRWDLQAEQVLVTAGADEALDRICRTWLGPGRVLLAPTPSFEMMLRYAELAGAELRSVPISGDRFPIEELLAADPTDVAIVAVVSPNNPTGSVASAEDLRRLSKAFPQALLLIDAAYAEYADEDLSRLALELPNALLVRTFSKAWGLAGLRVGWVAGRRDLVELLRRAAGPYPVAGPSLLMARARLEQEGDMRRGVARVRDERQQMLSKLRELGFDARPSQANFVYVPTPRARALRDALAGLGIAVRLFEAPEYAVRIGCPGDADALQRLLVALEVIAAPQALLLDVDGVLADVSLSYRAAIEGTLESYGCELESDAIARAKAAGDANDDWELTRRLLVERGVDRPLAEVRARFEALYQGDGERPGLRERESCLVDSATLKRLARGLPVALVTGRPRADAERFLSWSGLADQVDVLVAREDAERIKPDPAPVRAALAALGVTRAWMVGDTPDDVVAARAAGVLPLGVVAPGEDPERATQTLLRSGAAEVATRLPELNLLSEPLPC